MIHQSNRWIFWKNSSIQRRSDPFSPYWLISRPTPLALSTNLILGSCSWDWEKSIFWCTLLISMCIKLLQYHIFYCFILSFFIFVYLFLLSFLLDFLFFAINIKLRSISFHFTGRSKKDTSNIFLFRFICHRQKENLLFLNSIQY